MWDTFLTILGGGVSGLVGIFVFHYQRRKEIRHNYYVAMCELGCRSIEAAKRGNAAGFHRETLDEVRKNVLSLSPFLGSKSKTLLNLWTRYSQLTPDSLENQSQIYRASQTAVGEIPNTRPSRVLEIYFGDFIHIVKRKKDFVGFTPEEEIDPLLKRLLR